MKRTFLITGATKGIGLATATYLTNAGYTVVGVARHESQTDFPGTLYVADLADVEKTGEVFRKIKDDFEINGIINNVGIGKPQPIEEITLDAFNQAIDLNLRPAIQAMQVFLPQMKKRKWGRIVNITSRALLGKAGMTSFTAAKGGFISITRTWALELASFGITVNSVAPGPIATDAFYQNYPPDSVEESKILATLPLGRIGKPDEVAYAVAFFLDDRAAFVTGQTLFVDGGGSVGVNTC